MTGCFQVRPAEPTELTFFPSPPFYPPNFYRFALHQRQSFSLYSTDIQKRGGGFITSFHPPFNRARGVRVKKINRVVIPGLTMTKPSSSPCSKQLRSPCRIAFCSGNTFLRDDPSYLITLERTRRRTKETVKRGGLTLSCFPFHFSSQIPFASCGTGEYPSPSFPQEWHSRFYPSSPTFHANSA